VVVVVDRIVYRFFLSVNNSAEVDTYSKTDRTVLPLFVLLLNITITAIRTGLQQMVAQPARLEVLQSYTRPTAPDNVPILTA
jgi:hypothetical protein